MKEKDIIPLLYNKFDTQKYCLSNSYIFNSRWESDFFSVSSSGYCQEIEVKTSYSDFKADFKKEDKHSLLNRRFVAKDKRYRVRKGDLFYKVTYEEGKTKLDKNGKRIPNPNSKYSWDRYLSEPSGNIRTFHAMNLNHIKIREDVNIFNLKCEESYTEIKIEDMFKTLIPNKFCYDCPTNIIPLEEVPDYAGLMYINENGRFRYIKKPPFIHKDLQENLLNKTLLHKFYWLSLNQEKEIDILKYKLEKCK